MRAATQDDEANGFDVLRLGLALLVIYSHSYLIGGFGREPFLRWVHDQEIAGGVGVLGFFGLSGFLVTRSLAHRGDWVRYVRARCLRILPGFYAALLFTAFVAAPLIARFGPAGQPWHGMDAIRYVTGNLGVRVNVWKVGEIPAGLPYTDSINGALWSLFPELCCYGIVLAYGWFGWVRTASFGPQAAIAGAAVFLLNAGLVLAPGKPNVAPTLLSLTGWAPIASAFAVGSCAYGYRDALGLGPRGAAGWLLAVALILKFGGWALLGPLLLPLALVSLAYSFRLRLPTDLSYGLYVYHFPILHVAAAAGLARWGYLPYVGMALVATASVAWLSWTFVERPFLRLK